MLFEVGVQHLGAPCSQKVERRACVRLVAADWADWQTNRPRYSAFELELALTPALPFSIATPKLLASTSRHSTSIDALIDIDVVPPVCTTAPFLDNLDIDAGRILMTMAARSSGTLPLAARGRHVHSCITNRSRRCALPSRSGSRLTQSMGLCHIFGDPSLWVASRFSPPTAGPLPFFLPWRPSQSIVPCIKARQARQPVDRDRLRLSEHGRTGLGSRSSLRPKPAPGLLTQGARRES